MTRHGNQAQRTDHVGQEGTAIEEPLMIGRDTNGAITSYRMTAAPWPAPEGTYRVSVSPLTDSGLTRARTTPSPTIELRCAELDRRRDGAAPPLSAEVLELRVRHPQVRDCDGAAVAVAALQVLVVDVDYTPWEVGVDMRIFGYMGEPGFQDWRNLDDDDPHYWPPDQPGRPPVAARFAAPASGQAVVIELTREQRQ